MKKSEQRKILSSEKLYNEWRCKELGSKLHNELLQMTIESEKLHKEEEYKEEPDPNYIWLEGSYAEDKFTEQNESYFQKKH